MLNSKAQDTTAFHLKVFWLDSIGYLS